MFLGESPNKSKQTSVSDCMHVCIRHLTMLVLVALENK